jgi:hypothetical protein
MVTGRLRQMVTLSPRRLTVADSEQPLRTAAAPEAAALAKSLETQSHLKFSSELSGTYDGRIAINLCRSNPPSRTRIHWPGLEKQ